MKQKWVIPIALALVGGLGYLYWKDRKGSSGQATTTLASGSQLTVHQPGPLANTSLGSYIDPNGGLNYIDAVPAYITSSTGFTAQDFNYGAVNEQPVAQLGNGMDLVTNPNGSGYAVVPRGVNSLQSYESVVG